ncbi:hypothetical protein ACJX0J_014754, partial [Zea mays]
FMYQWNNCSSITIYIKGDNTVSIHLPQLVFVLITFCILQAHTLLLMVKSIIVVPHGRSLQLATSRLLFVFYIGQLVMNAVTWSIIQTRTIIGQTYFYFLHLGQQRSPSVSWDLYTKKMKQNLSLDFGIRSIDEKIL